MVEPDQGMAPEEVGPVMNIAVDFDGVIHWYRKGWNGGAIYDIPMPGCKEAMKQLQGQGHRLIIFSARAYAQRKEMEAWLKVHNIPYNEIATDAKPLAHVYLDDRGLRFVDWRHALAALESIAEAQE